MTLALVTGPSRGIGRATALWLAERGVNLVLMGRQSAELDQTGELCAQKVQVSLEHCDLADRTALGAACSHVLASAVPDVIISNAAVIERRSVELTSLDAWDHQLAVNLRAPFQIARAFLPALRARKSGRIIHVGSISSTLGSANAAAYAASKWGLTGFTKSLAEELTGSGVIALVVLPGSVDTEMLEGSGFAPRMSADDVARTLVHYALDAPLAHNGAVIEMFGV
ncbi:MAG: SDR family oxidoreductase [Polyangiaceae bacterium]|nr:SDR family oxidoreductase [Polyangiaceae bacterium]